MEDLRSEERTWGTLTHIGGFAGGFIPFGNIFAPLIIWQLKKNESNFVDENGKSSLNFQISFTIYVMILALLAFLLFFTSFTETSSSSESLPLSIILIFGLFGILAIVQFILLIMASIKASQGEIFYYPLTIRFIK